MDSFNIVTTITIILFARLAMRLFFGIDQFIAQEETKKKDIESSSIKE